MLPRKNLKKCTTSILADLNLVTMKKLVSFSGIKFSAKEMTTKQDAFDKNLRGTSLETPLNRPEHFRESSDRVGDITFFNVEHEDYEWIDNAFDCAIVSL